MTEKEKLMKNLVEKSGKSIEDLNHLISEKVNELSGLISEEGAIYIIANELGVRLEGERPKKDADLVKINQITEPKTPVSFICKVIRKYDRVTFSSKNGEGSVQSIFVGDETGVNRVVFWNDKTELLDNVHEGDILKIVNAYTRENTNQERIEVHYGQYSNIEVNPKGVTIELKEFKPQGVPATEKKISEIVEGDRNIKISAIITDFDIPRFYLGCPECFKKVFQDEGVFKCGEHGEVKAQRIPIVNLVVDDSSATISIVGFRDRAENITTLAANEIIGLTEDIDKYRNFSKKIIGSKIEFVGNASSNNITGESQILVNLVNNIEFKTVDEIAQELINEEKKSSKPKKEEKPEVLNLDDDLEDIEEIDIDDDLL